MGSALRLGLEKRTNRRVTRRALLAAAGAGVAGAALSRLAPWEVGIAPAQIKGTTLRILVWSHFVPAYDTAFDKFAADWGKQNGVSVRVDHISVNDVPARIASELAAGSGHDIFQFVGQIFTTLYYQHMVDVTDICNRLAKANGGWIPMAENVSVVNGHWYAVPEYYIAQPVLWRTDLFKEYGIKPPRTWDDLLAAARTGKSKGHPTGFAISHCNDSNHNWRAVLYAFGVEETDPSGKELRWDSKALREGMKFAKALWSEGMTSEVFSWDNVSDNRYLDSGVAIYIHDAISAIRSIQDSNPKLYASVDIGVPGTLEPKGPVRSAAVSDPNILAIWKFSKNQQGAREFLEHYCGSVKFSLEASKGYNLPFLKGAYKKPMPGLGDDPKVALMQDWDKVTLVSGFPGPYSAPAAEVVATFVVPDMLARYCHGEDLESSIKWGLGQIRGIYSKYKK